MEALGILTALLALIASAGDVGRLFADHPADAAALQGQIATAALFGGTMALYGLGRLLDRYGPLPGYGVWVLYLAHYLHRGVQAIGAFLATHPGGEVVARIGVEYGAASLALLAVLLALLTAQRPIDTISKGPEGPTPPSLALPLFIGGIIIPIAGADIFLALPDIVAQMIGGEAARWMGENYYPGTPILWLEGAQDVALLLLIVVWVRFVAAASYDGAAIAQELEARDCVLPGAAPGLPTAAILEGMAARVSLVAGLALACLVVVAPVLFGLVTGIPSQRLTVGGRTFVIVVSLILAAIGSATRSRTQPDAAQT